MTTDEARALIQSVAACGEQVSIFAGDADEFYLDACDWDYDRIVVWIQYRADANLREERILGRFDSHDEASNFVAAISSGTPENVMVF